MKIEAVKAPGFGPFSGDVLGLAPGMNVIYGPNESGKSSWHAAIYAAMCGTRKTRGQPTREDREFARRHRPWRGTTWQVTAVLVLDDGRTIEIEQQLGSGGRSVARDRDTKRPLSGDMVRAGAIDAATLLGLTRETALATVFIRQADMLRVRNEAGALQEYLERAVATSTADTTAEEALARITGYRKERIGLLRAGSRGPLAAATRRLRDARDALDAAEERFESYQELLGQRHAAELDVREIDERLKDVVEYERERARQERWTEIRAAERRLDQARRLTDETARTSTATVDKDLIAAVNRALARFESRPAEPADLHGPSAETLEQQLAVLPDMPAGDLEPLQEVIELAYRWRAVQQRLAAHDENEPLSAGTPPVSVAPLELRRLADELELPIPHVDAELVEDIRRRRSAAGAPPAHLSIPETASPAPTRESQRSPVPIAIGGVLAVAATILVLVGQLVLGIALLLVGAGVAAAAMRGRSRSGTPTDLPATAAAFSVTIRPPDPDLLRMEARLALQQESQAQAQRRRESALTRIAELAVSADVGELRRLAAAADAAMTAEARRNDWKRRRAELEAGVSAAGEALGAGLSARGVAIRDGADLETALARYGDECRKRAAIAREARRRADLEAQLANRRAAEASREQDRATRHAAGEQLLAVAGAAGCKAQSLEELAGMLRDWVSTQEELDEIRHRHDKTAARLDQVLEGLSLAELEAEVAELVARAGDPPPDDAAPKPDRSSELTALQARARASRDLLSELTGQIEAAEKHLVDVSPAIEAEARAAAEVDQLTSVAEDLDAASEILGAAQEKVHADIAPILNETIRPWVSRITRGRYDDIRVDPA